MAKSGLSQPSLHRAVGDLSMALKRPLLERRGRGLMLTDAGRRNVRAFRLARAELKSGLAEIAALSGVETGRIAIGAMPLSRARLLPKAVASFHRLNPQVEIVIAEDASPENIDEFLGNFDVVMGQLLVLH